MRIDFLGLQAFLGVAERGSFHRAAAHLNLSQTALSHRLKKLEDSLGVKLLLRTTRQVSLTPAGAELLPKARRIVEELSASLADLRDRGRLAQERIAIGCLPTIAVRYMPRVLKLFRETRPDTAVRVFDNSAAEIAAKVQSGEAEFGVTVVAANRWDLELTPLMKEPFVLVCPATHRLARQPSVAWAELEGEPLVRISAETGNRVLIDDALGGRSEALTWRYEVQRVTTAVSLVSEGMALAVAPQVAFDVMSVKGAVMRPLRAPVVMRTIGVVARRGLPLSAGAAALLDIIRRELTGARAGKAARAKG